MTCGRRRKARKGSLDHCFAFDLSSYETQWSPTVVYSFVEGVFWPQPLSLSPRLPIFTFFLLFRTRTRFCSSGDGRRGEKNLESWGNFASGDKYAKEKGKKYIKYGTHHAGIGGQNGERREKIKKRQASCA